MADAIQGTSTPKVLTHLVKLVQFGEQNPSEENLRRIVSVLSFCLSNSI